MVASGLCWQEGDPCPARTIVDFAKLMLETTVTVLNPVTGHPLQMRVGIHRLVGVWGRRGKGIRGKAMGHPLQRCGSAFRGQSVQVGGRVLSAALAPIDCSSYIDPTTQFGGTKGRSEAERGDLGV